MWSLLKSWIYRTIVRSGIVYRLLWLAYPAQFILLTLCHNGDTIKDRTGRTLNVTRWNGRVMAAFWYWLYDRIKSMDIKDDDVIICGYPKTGCHWTHEILYMLLHNKPEMSKYGKVAEGMMEAMPDIILDSVPSPRVLNTHVYYDELPEMVKKRKNKIILTIRCPKDTVVSYFNHTKNLSNFYKYQGTFDSYVEMFLGGGADYGCYFQFYRIWEKVVASHPDQIFVLSFEDLKANPIRKIREIAEFLGRPVSEDFAQQIAEVSSFSSIKKKRPANVFFRKGVVGDWKNWLTEDQARRVDEVWREKMSGFHMHPVSTASYCR